MSWHGNAFCIIGPLWVQSNGHQIYFIRVTSSWARWRIESPASRLFTQSFVQAQIKENIKAPRHWPLWGEFTGEFPAQSASNAENVSIWWRHHAVLLVWASCWINSWFVGDLKHHRAVWNHCYDVLEIICKHCGQNQPYIVGITITKVTFRHTCCN